MFRNTRGCLSRPSHSNYPALPEYPFPSELAKVLDVNEQSELSDKARMYSTILETLSKVKYVDLSEDHYVQLLKLALYLEEFQRNEEMKRRKLFKQTIQRYFTRKPYEETLFKIHVQDLDEERPWIREGDFVDVIDAITDELYTLKVTFVEKTNIVASDDARSLNKVYRPKNLYDISFRFQNYPLRCAHYALWLTHKENAITYLYPQTSKSFVKLDNETLSVFSNSCSTSTLTMFNSNIKTNPEQKQAIVNIVKMSSFPAPYILYGPPGTGKTATLVEAICQIRQSSPLNRILVCTPSNTAADEIAKRLRKFVPARSMYRVYSQSKNRSTVDEELKDCSYCGGGEKIPLTFQDIAGKTILVSTLCNATRFLLMKLKADYFSHIIIDEAGQGTEADILIPIGVASKNGKLHSQVVLAGDPQQLGPTVISKLAEIIMGRSILERIMSYDTYQKDCHNNYNPKYITKLLQNYRSHPSIIHISNNLFYDNELIPKVAIDDQTKKFPVIFHGVEGIEEKLSNSPSILNKTEINVVMNYVDDLIDNKTDFGEVSASDIGIVTPFTLQSKKIKKILKTKDSQERRKLEDYKKAKDIKLLKKVAADNATSTDGETENAKSTNIRVEDDKSVLESEKDVDNVDADSNNDEIMLKNKNEKDTKVQETDKGGNGARSKNLQEKVIDADSDYDEDAHDNETKNDNHEVNTGDAKIKLQMQKTKGDAEKNAETNDTEGEIKYRSLKDINVGTVELFQGQERRIMIMTAVRNKTFVHDGVEHIGFLNSRKRFNVAMSRAQEVLIVIGNPGILQKDDMWHYLLKYCKDNESYSGLEFELRDSCNEILKVSESQSIATSASLFEETPFQLFSLDGLATAWDVSRTVNRFAESGRVAFEQRGQRRLRENFRKLRLHN